MSSGGKKGFNTRWASAAEPRGEICLPESSWIIGSTAQLCIFRLISYNRQQGWWLSIPAFCSGEHPRNFSIHPSGNWLLVANQDTWLCADGLWRVICYYRIPSLLFLSLTSLLLVWMNGWMDAWLIRGTFSPGLRTATMWWSFPGIAALGSWKIRAREQAWRQPGRTLLTVGMERGPGQMLFCTKSVL